MLGLIKKDFLIIKANLKTLSIIFIVFFILMIQGSFDVTFVMPMIGVMIFVATFSYDDFNNWNSYAVSLPNGRKNVVRAKYIASIIFTIILGIVSVGLSIIIGYMKSNNIDLNGVIISLAGTILSAVIIISFLYPIMFKFGATNARIILFGVVFGVVGIITVIAKFIDMTTLISILDRYFYIAIPAISIIALGTSYLISNRIYQNKEF